MDNKNELIALFDMDGTLCDYEGALHRDLKKLESPEERGRKYTWDDEHYMEARKALIKSQPGWWRNLSCLPVGFEILEIVMKAGFMPHILTKGPYNTASAWSEKLTWCRENLPKDTPVTVTENKGLVYGRILVDDYPPYIEQWLEWRPRGLVIMPAYSYNKDFKDHNVIRYDGSESIKNETIDRVRLAASR